MKLKTFFSIGLLFFCSTINTLLAQNFSEWGKITAEELSNTEMADVADAVILLDYGKINVASQTDYSFKKYRKFKILKRAGFELGTVSIPYVAGEDYEQFLSFKAQITNPSGKTTQLTEKDFLTEKINKNLSIRKIIYPQIEVGAVLEYTFELKSKSLATLKDWYFQAPIPTKKSKLELTLAPHFKYDFHTQGPALDIATVNGKPFSTDRNDPNYSHGFAGMVNEYVFIREDIPALQTLPFVNNMQDHYERIKFPISQMPTREGMVQLSHTNWHPAVRSLTNDNRFGWQYKTKGYFKNVVNAVKPLLKETKDKEAQLGIIYTYLLDNIKIVEKEGILVEKSLNTCFKEKQASKAELNLMMIALAKNLKIGDASPMAISTRAHGKIMEDYPFLDQFDHILAYIELSDKVVLIDAANPYLPMGYPAMQSANKRGLLIRPLARWKDITVPMSSSVFKGEFVMDETGHLSGDIQVKEEGYGASITRAAFAKDASGKEWAKRLEDKYLDFDLQNVKVANQAAINQPVALSASLEIANIGQQTEAYIYFNPLLYTSQEENPFKQVDRILPIDFPYPYKQEQEITIQIPDNYEIVSIPESQKMTVDNIGHFDYTLNKENQKISITYTFQINEAIVAPSAYPQLRELYDTLVEKTQELVTLKRKVE